MAKQSGKGAVRDEKQYIRTAINLAKKGKTNKKLKRNPNAQKFNK